MVQPKAMASALQSMAASLPLDNSGLSGSSSEFNPTPVVSPSKMDAALQQLTRDLGSTSSSREETDGDEMLQALIKERDFH